MRTISSAAASERVRVMEGNERVDKSRVRREHAGKVSRQRQHENYRLQTTVEWSGESMLMPVCPKRYHNKLGNEIFTK